MLPYNDPETLMLFVEQRREELRRTMQGTRSLSDLLVDARRRVVGMVRRPRWAARMRTSKRPV